MVVLAVYSGYVFSKIFDDLNQSRPDRDYRTFASLVFATYFNWSFANKTWSEPPRMDSWEGALWEIRGRCGKDFTDRALFYTLKTLDDFVDPNQFPRSDNYTISHDQVNKYFLDRFIRGEQVVDNRMGNRGAIYQILKKRGLWAR
jgi:hypothetical protein